MPPALAIEKTRTDLRIRRATAADARAVASLLREAFARFEPLYTAGGFAATTPGAEEIRRRLRLGPTWLASRERVIGTVSALVTPKGLYIRSMAVHPWFRRIGAGRLLLGAVEAYAAAHDHRRLFLSTTPFLDEAIALYRRSGFQDCPDGPHQLHGTPLFTLEKLLPGEGEANRR